MIYTRFGTPVTLTHKPTVNNFVRLIAHYPEGDRPREWHIAELKADGGLEEIMKATETLPESK